MPRLPKESVAHFGGNNLYGLLLLARDVLEPDDTVIEVGSAFGASTMLFARLCKHVYSIDKRQTPELVKLAGHLGNVTLIHEDCLTAHKHFDDGQVDGVYIDGNHHAEYVVQDIRNYAPKVKRFVAGHDLVIGDYSWLLEHYQRDIWKILHGVREAVDQLIGLENVRQYPDSSWATLKADR